MTQASSNQIQAELQRALALHKGGAIAEAAKVYTALLKQAPDNFDLTHYLGMALLQMGKADQALGYLEAAGRLNPRSAAALNNLGVAYDALSRPDDALQVFDRALEIKPDFVEPAARKAAILHRAGRLAEAVMAYDAVLTLRPDAGLLNNKAVALRDLSRGEEALAAIDAALSLQPRYADAWVNKGNVLQDLGRVDAAMKAYDAALHITPQHPAALAGIKGAMDTASNPAAILHALDEALAKNPADGAAHLRRAEVLHKQRRYEEALDAYTMAAQYRPYDPAVFIQWAGFLIELQRYDGAMTAYDAALKLSEDSAEAHFGRAEALRELNRIDEAEEAYKRGQALDPTRETAHDKKDPAALFYDRAEARRMLNRPEDAVSDYDRVYAVNPDYPYVQGNRLHTLMHLADWRDYKSVPAMLEKLRARKPVVQPFPLVALPATAEDQMISAELYAASKYPLRAPVWQGEKYNHDKIRVAYLSADFHRHATAYLMAGLFEAHDRIDFEWTALSWGKDDQSPMRQRLVSAFDHFIDVRGMSDEAVSRLIREREIDIVVDLKGYTQNSRFGILTRRCAPVQVTYIGYPGTLASPAVDYAIADPTIITPDIEPFFSEKIIYLPHSYQVNDSKREIAPFTPSRSELGLPETGMVYCSFNQTYKVTPDVFDVWMRILSRVPDSVLWLYTSSETAVANLRREAKNRGIDASRIILAKHAKLEDHLARLSQADLFLDNAPCNAHTTASDALWAGVPVLTCPGQTFAGRVAASLLTAIDMPELIMADMAAYEEKAVSLGTDAAARKALRTTLAQNRLTAPLFDTARSARNIETAYREIHRRFHAGEKLDHVHVAEEVRPN